MSPYIPIELVPQVRSRAQDICEYCLLPQSSQEATFHIDHVVPRQSGGATDEGNLALACVTCSLRKSAKLEAVDLLKGDLTRLLNPREQTWGEHFVLA